MKNTIEYEDIHENKKYKDTLFRLIFKEKKDLLDLYNAVNGTAYTEIDDLEINTLENVVYMSYKNDISFLISDVMNLYEHQSTCNENMPLRGLLYLAKLINKYIKGNGLNLYHKKIQKLPTPQYVVFYNGTAEEPDERIMRLSDAFLKGKGCLECEARLLNINYGHNRELMEKCKKLKEYAIFVARVRKYVGEDHNQRKAITRAVDECIEEGILKDILEKNRSEIMGFVLTTFNQELYEKDLKADAYEEGVEAGRTAGIETGKRAGIAIGERGKLLDLVRKKLAKGKSAEEIADVLEEDVTVIRELIRELE